MAGRITAIRLQKRDTRRVNVFIEGEFALGLALELAVGLSKGQYLSDAEIADLRAADEQARAYEQALDFLAPRPRSQAEVANRLRRKGFSESAVKETLTRLSRAGLIDDEAFARYWIANREQFRPRGRRALRYELRRKGVPDRVIDELLPEVDEVESACRAARQRMHKWRNLDPATRRRKMSDYLRRRGFDYEVIREAWGRLQAEEGEDIEIWDV